MIIEKITVENWRTLKNPQTLEFCGGVNIIHGDNGRGKSTLMEALRMGFFDRHNITGDDIKKIRPWGCELNPRVQIEFCHNGKNYRLTKQFIGQKSSLVELKDDLTGDYQRYMESDGADAWLRSVMSGDASVRGITGKTEHWGLAGLLWVRQGVSDYGGLSSALTKRITDSKPAEQSGERLREGSVENALKKEFLKYFNESGTRRGGANSLKETEAEIGQKRFELDKKRQQLESMDGLRDNIVTAKKKIDECGAAQVDIQKRLKEAETKIAVYDRLKAEHDAARARRDVLESERKLLEMCINNIKESRNGIDRHKKQIAARTKDIDDANARMKRIDEQISEKLAEKHGLDSLIKLKFTAETNVAWVPIAGDPVDKREINNGETTMIEGIGKIQVRLPNVGTFTITGPVNDNAAALQERIASLRQQYDLCVKNIEGYKRDTDNCNESIERANAKIAEVLVGGKTTESIACDHKNILGELHVVNNKMKECGEHVQKLGYNPHKEIDGLKRKSEDLRNQQERNHKLISDYQGQLKALGGMGLYEEVDTLEEELRKTEAAFSAETLRANALKLIWDTATAVKREFKEQVSAPVEKRASELFSLVNDRRAGTIRLNNDFNVVGFVPEELGATAVNTDELSGGEREQLYFCTRLALAERIIGDNVNDNGANGSNTAEKYALILDDFLTATDERRLSRLKNLLLTFQYRYQYLIFTCHRERYVDINGVDTKVIEL